MPEYLAPGVYVEEISTGPRPIEGVSTSTTGFAGQTERGPEAPKLVTSWQEFVGWYGTYVDRDPSLRNIYLPYAVRGFFDNGGQRLFIARVTGPAGGTATATLAGDPGGTVISANGPGVWGNNIRFIVTPSSLAEFAKDGSPVKNWFRVRLIYYRDGIADDLPDPTDPNQLANPKRLEPDVFEDFDNLSPISMDSNYAKSVINASSKLIVVDTCDGKPGNVAFADKVMQNGTTVEATSVEYLDKDQPDPEKAKGLKALEQIRDISIIGIPDEVVVDGLTDAMVDLCERLKDRFAIVSERRRSGDVATIIPPRDTTYAGFYYPWIRVSASHTPEGHILIPPIGQVAGIFARTDIDRGVHKAPANEVVRGIITRDLNGNKKPLEFTLNKQKQDILNPKGVNVIRDFRPDRRDIRVWGARTMSSDAMWKYINVRRLFIFVEQSIDRGTQWAVFEPNYESTWTAIRLSISSFLRTVWRNGALAGTTQDEAFFVKCDRTTMTQDDIDNGRLICLIGIAPVKPAEFVIFRISQKTIEAES
jgi:phage tail sheath protein FI